MKINLPDGIKAELEMRVFRAQQDWMEKKEREMLGDEMYDALHGSPEKLGLAVIESIIKEAFDRKPTAHVLLCTGHNGCKEILKAMCKTYNLTWNFKNMMGMYRFMKESGQLKGERRGNQAIYQIS